jgi:hypothetical protein
MNRGLLEGEEVEPAELRRPINEIEDRIEPASKLDVP